MEDRGEVCIVYYIRQRSIQLDDLGVKVEPGVGYTRGESWSICVECLSPRAHVDQFVKGKTKGWAWEK